MRVGMISAAHVHAASYASILKEEGRFEFVGVWDDDPERGKSFSKEYDVLFFNNIGDLLKNVDVVIITSENSKHLQHLKMVIGNVKGVLCEKPLAPTIDDAREMVELAKSYGVKLGVAFPVRFHPVSKRVKEIFESEELGSILVITSSNRGQLPPGWFTDPDLAGGGAIMDHVVHLVDLFRWFTKKEFKEVLTFRGRNIHPELDVEDCAILRLDLSGIPMTLDCSWAMPKSHPYWGEVVFRVVFEKGIVEADVFSQNLIFESNEGSEIEWINYGENADREMLLAFSDWVEGKEVEFPTGEDGLRATEVVERAYESLERGRGVRINEEG